MSDELAKRRDDLRLLARVREVFGDALTLVILAGRTVSEEDSATLRNMKLKLDLASRALADRQNASSLGTAVDIADELLKVEAKSTVQAWSVGQNPLLEDRAPAHLVRTDRGAVWDAANHFIAYG